MTTPSTRPLTLWILSLALLWMTASYASHLFFAQTGQMEGVAAPFNLESKEGWFEMVLASSTLLSTGLAGVLFFAGSTFAIVALHFWFWLNLSSLLWVLFFRGAHEGSLLQLGAPAVVALGLIFYSSRLRRQGVLQ